MIQKQCSFSKSPLLPPNTKDNLVQTELRHLQQQNGCTNMNKLYITDFQVKYRYIILPVTRTVVLHDAISVSSSSRTV